MLFGKRERIIHRILIVEDEPLVAFDNEHFLTEAGYEIVATVDTLADARRVLEDGREIDLILADIHLRGDGDGTDLARDASARGVRVLLVSGHEPPDDHDVAVGYLTKPYSDKMLTTALSILETHLSGKRVKRLPPGLKLFSPADVDPRRG